MSADTLRSLIRSVPDFPKPGIMFRDITTLIGNGPALQECVELLYAHYRDDSISAVVGIESRGFIVGAALAVRLGVGFVPIRKPGKLPAATLRKEYALEYGTDAVEIHRDALPKGARVLLHDDLLATGGTIAAACSLLEQMDVRIVGLAFLIELSFLNGRGRLGDRDVFSLVRYDAE